ncbi:hypothetical protein [Parafrankia sp. EUN1f]|uniref:hypothetical protein n=1 Tax=Parafrankia sp. EUN1f TaxID=102897 RepID=UPI0001C46468|nr:hypothetical protein [Parafrankia sp. EUN1f]EFC80904.1 hypothetical protein FrEUN1fDRAFT_6006 [Parafrankia sp. EUN1f]
MAEREIPVRADQIRPGDRINYAGDWRPVRSAQTVTIVYAGGIRLEYEADMELTVRRTTAVLDLLPADADLVHAWEDLPEPVASYRITLTPATSEETETR